MPGGDHLANLSTTRNCRKASAGAESANTASTAIRLPWWVSRNTTIPAERHRVSARSASLPAPSARHRRQWVGDCACKVMMRRRSAPIQPLRRKWMVSEVSKPSDRPSIAAGGTSLISAATIANKVLPVASASAVREGRRSSLSGSLNPVDDMPEAPVYRLRVA